MNFKQSSHLYPFYICKDSGRERLLFENSYHSYGPAPTSRQDACAPAEPSSRRFQQLKGRYSNFRTSPLIIWVMETAFWIRDFRWKQFSCWWKCRIVVKNELSARNTSIWIKWEMLLWKIILWTLPISRLLPHSLYRWTGLALWRESCALIGAIACRDPLGVGVRVVLVLRRKISIFFYNQVLFLMCIGLKSGERKENRVTRYRICTWLSIISVSENKRTKSR